MTKPHYEFRVTCRDCGKSLQHDTLTGILTVPDSVIVNVFSHDCKPQPKTRNMNYSELRALALQGAWFRDYQDRCFPIRAFVNETEELSGMAVDSFHAIYKDYTFDAITFHPLTVTEDA